MDKRNAPVVSVIIPTFNSASYIQNVFECLQTQSFRKFEVIFVDDGSIDSTIDLINEFILTIDVPVTIERQKHLGVSEARNMGIKLSSGEFITFMDADDIMQTSHLKTLSDLCVQNGADFALSLFSREGGVTENPDTKGTWRIVSERETERIICGRNSVMGFVWNKMYVRSIIINNKLCFDKCLNNMEDLIFNLTYLRFAKRVLLSSSRTYVYKTNKQGTVNGGRSFGTTFKIKWIKEIRDYRSVLKFLETDYPAGYTEFLPLATWEFNFIRLLIRESGSLDKYRDLYSSLTKFSRIHSGDIVKSRDVSFYKKTFFLISLIFPTIARIVPKK